MPAAVESFVGAPFCVSVADAERLSLQSRFVRNQVDALFLEDLLTRLRSATVLQPPDVPPDLVTMNSQVVLRDLDTGRRSTWTLAFPANANPRKGRISVLTPLGSLLLGARTGQQLTCPLAGSVATVEVEAILHQPEAAGDYYG